MWKFLILSALVAVLSGCQKPGSPQETGLYPLHRDVFEVDAARLTTCARAAIERYFLRGQTPHAGQIDQAASPNGDMVRLIWTEAQAPGWEIRFTSAGPRRTVVEIDVSPTAWGADKTRQAFPYLIAACAEKLTRNR